MDDNKEGFVFFPSFYDAYQAAKAVGHGSEYLEAMVAYAFEGKEPTSENVVMTALYSAFKPVIDTSQKDRRNGKKGGRPKKENPGF